MLFIVNWFKWSKQVGYEIHNDLSDDAVLKEIGNRITQYRLNQDKTQVALAQEAGVSNRAMPGLNMMIQFRLLA